MRLANSHGEGSPDRFLRWPFNRGQTGLQFASHLASMLAADLDVMLLSSLVCFPYCFHIFSSPCYLQPSTPLIWLVYFLAQFSLFATDKYNDYVMSVFIILANVSLLLLLSSSMVNHTFHCCASKSMVQYMQHDTIRNG